MNDNSGHEQYEPLKGLRALDVGCGGGILSESLSRLGADVTAIDPSVEAVDIAKKHGSQDAKMNPIEYRGGWTVENVADKITKKKEEHEEDEMKFDVICVLDVIEHASSPDTLLQSVSSILKPRTETCKGGTLFVSTVNRTWKSFGVAILGAEYILRKLPVGTHSWTNFMTPMEVEVMISRYRLRTLTVKGMVLRPPYLNMKWDLEENDVDVNWIGAYGYS